MTAAAIGLSMQVIAGDCHEQWLPGDGVPGVDHQMFYYKGVYALALWDPNGEGPESTSLVAAGSFTLAGDVTANDVARWDGRTWHAMDAGVAGTPEALLAVDLDGDGPGPAELFMGVSYTPGDSLVLRWSGSSWLPLGELYGVGVHGLTGFDPDGPGPQPASLAASGYCYDEDFGYGVVALWTGTRWNVFGEAYGGGKDTNAYAIASIDWDGHGPQAPQLIVGGNFNVIDGVAAAKVASWDGETWHALGSGVNGLVLALYSWDPDGHGPAGPLLTVGGSFTTAGGMPASHIATWDGQLWSALGAGTSGAIHTLASFGAQATESQHSDLIAGGHFGTAGGVAVGSIARWDGQDWHDFSGGCNLHVLEVVPQNSPTSPALYVGGTFDSAGGIGALHVARWQDDQWHTLGTGFDYAITSLLTYDPDPSSSAPPLLVAGGGFEHAGSVPALHVASWNSHRWQPLGEGVGIYVNAMAQHDFDQDPKTPPELIACGNAYSSPFFESPVIQAWDGLQWAAVGRLERQPFSNLICRDVLSCDLDGEGGLAPQLYASGAIQLGSIHAGVVRWTGADWTPVGGSTSSSGVVHAIEMYDPDDTGPAEALLVAGGTFQFLGGMSPINLAAWNGREWTAIGTPNQSVSALKTHDFDGPGPQLPELLVGGAFTFIGAIPASHVARWNGVSWSSLVGGTNGGAYDFTAFDPDGAGPLSTRLVVAGYFTMAGGVPCNYIAQTDGRTWEPFAGGLSSTGQALAVYDPDRDGPLAPQLAVGGSFLLTDNQPSAFFARWGFEATPFHPADSDCSGTIDGVDLAALLGQWTGSAAYAPCPPYQLSDLNQDCRINGFDLALLLGAWTS